ncbi:hypothetical protein COV11_04375 [Candidatus Woesearchaeota archaeon CG10_big_fil_rev_8_21_14_0_10_30_7]|nr:MAG: hypothetical protein COV11_04375 [Candidatus Woesearchaeota archaeon CG10_big_fil_rev_8_21_14_0_10_30_7]
MLKKILFVTILLSFLLIGSCVLQVEEDFEKGSLEKTEPSELKETQEVTEELTRVVERIKTKSELLKELKQNQNELISDPQILVLPPEVPSICGDGFCFLNENFCIVDCKKGTLNLRDSLLIISDEPSLGDYETAQEIIKEFSREARFEPIVMSQVRKSTIIRTKLIVFLNNQKALLSVHESAPVNYVVLLNKIFNKLKIKGYTANQKIHTELKTANLEKELP